MTNMSQVRKKMQEKYAKISTLCLIFRKIIGRTLTVELQQVFGCAE